MGEDGGGAGEGEPSLVGCRANIYRPEGGDDLSFWEIVAKRMLIRRKMVLYLACYETT